jgi:uncharacterized repeat protein (TIGR01451 family)
MLAVRHLQSARCSISVMGTSVFQRIGRSPLLALLLTLGQAQPAYAGDLVDGLPQPPRADLSISKSDSPDPVSAGSKLTYFLSLRNAGPDAASGVTLTDAVPTGTTFVSLTQTYGPTFTCSKPPAGGTGTVRCTKLSFAAWALAKFTLVVKVNEAVPAGAVITNTAVVSSTTTDPNAANNSDTETTQVKAPSADLSVTKTDSPDPVTAGSNISYTLTVRNAGPCNAQAVTLADVVPVGTTFVSFTAPAGWTTSTPAPGGTGTVTATIPTFADGASAVFTLVVNVNAALPAGTITNTATVTSSTSDPKAANNSDTETTSVNAAPTADLSVTKTDSPDPVTAGSNLTYTLIVSNAGPNAASGLTLTDVVPVGTTFVSFTVPAGWDTSTPTAGSTGTVTATTPTLANGATATFTLVVNVNAALPAGTITNTAAVASNTIDPAPANNSDTETTTVGTVADLSVTKTDSPDPVNAGSNITYTITVGNAGPSDAQAVTLTDVIPVGTTFVSISVGSGCMTPAAGSTGTVTCTRPTIPDNSGFTFTLVVNVNAALPAGTVITNTATVTSTTTDPNAADNSATETTTVGTLADLRVTKTDSPDPVTAGSDITYTIWVDNLGPSDVSSLTLTDVLPVGTTFVSVGNAGTACTTPAPGSTGTISCTRSLAAGFGWPLTVVVNVNAALPAGTVISNTATVTSTTTDPNAANNSDTETTTVGPIADLSVTKTDAEDPVIPGSDITYTITVTNAGPSAAQAVTLTDTVVPVGGIVSFTGPAGWTTTTFINAAQTTEFFAVATIPTLASGATAVFTLVVHVFQATPTNAVITNTATVSSTTTDPTPANNSDTETTSLTT